MAWEECLFWNQSLGVPSVEEESPHKSQWITCYLCNDSSYSMNKYLEHLESAQHKEKLKATLRNNCADLADGLRAQERLIKTFSKF
jgi:hypothetical protein